MRGPRVKIIRGLVCIYKIIKYHNITIELANHIIKEQSYEAERCQEELLAEPVLVFNKNNGSGGRLDEWFI